jgi:hypothetical protein
MNEETTSLEIFGKRRWSAGLVGILGMILWMVGFAAQPDHKQAMYGYLFGFVFWASLTIGCLGILVLQGALKSSWGIAVVRIMEAAAGPSMLLLLLVLFLPIAMPGLGFGAIYKWADPAYLHSDPVLAQKTWYLTWNGFMIRTLVAGLLWAIWSFLLKRSSLRQDQSLDKKEWDFRSSWGASGLVMFFITVTMVSTDWVMSLNAYYFSTIYGIIFCIGAGLSAMSLAVLLILLNSDKPPYRAIVTPKLTRDLGNVYLALTMLWAYTTLSQFLITWQGNLPLEVPYYMHRSGSALFTKGLEWNVLSNLVILFQFFVPFLAMLAPRAKRVIRNMIWVSATVFVIRIFTVYWLVFPDLRPTEGFGGSLGHWTDYAAFFGIGGIWLWAFFTSLVKAPLIPKYDTRLMEAEHA